MNHKANWNRNAQLVVALLCALTLKLYYSTASANQLRWILAPTTFFVELVSGTSFEFESHAGYITSDRSFVIAASCAGVNFLITAFLMLALRKLWRDRSQSRSQDRSDNPSPNIAWRFIPVAALCAYVATIVANTVRISTALRLHRMPLELSWLSSNQLHRFEGIFIYFGFLLLLFMVSERMGSENAAGLPPHAGWRRGDPGLPPRAGRGPQAGSPLRVVDCPRRDPGLFRQCLFPLLIYYLTTLGIPLANGAYRRGIAATDFWEHAVFVLLTPLLVILPLALCRFYKWSSTRSDGMNLGRCSNTEIEPAARPRRISDGCLHHVED